MSSGEKTELLVTVHQTIYIEVVGSLKRAHFFTRYVTLNRTPTIGMLLEATADREKGFPIAFRVRDVTIDDTLGTADVVAEPRFFRNTGKKSISTQEDLDFFLRVLIGFGLYNNVFDSKKDYKGEVPQQNEVKERDLFPEEICPIEDSPPMPVDVIFQVIIPLIMSESYSGTKYKIREFCAVQPQIRLEYRTKVTHPPMPGVTYIFGKARLSVSLKDSEIYYNADSGHWTVLRRLAETVFDRDEEVDQVAGYFYQEGYYLFGVHGVEDGTTT